MYLFVSDNQKLVPLDESMYTVDKNRIVFNMGIQDLIDVSDMNITTVSEIPISITVRYSHYPVYHVIDVNRELMKVREGKFCEVSDERLRQMPINVTARKAHFIFDAQKWGEESFDNTIIGGER